MTTELTKENTLLLNLRIINFFTSILAIFLIFWMTIGESFLSPLCELKILVARKESCLRNGAIEMRDRASIVILTVLTVASIFALKSKYIKNTIIKQSFLTSSVDKLAFILIIAAFASRDYYPSFKDWSINEFSGLGFDVAVVAITLTLVALYWPQDFTRNNLNQTNLQSKWKITSLVSLIVFTVFYFPAILLHRSNIVWSDITTLVFNELLAPVAGNFPLADSIPQYNSLLGFPILMLAKLFGLRATFSIIPLWISTITLGILGTLTTIWIRLFPNLPKLFALLCVSSIILARSSGSSSAYTVASFPSWTVRMALPALVALLLHVSLSVKSSKSTVAWTLGLGVATSLALINNFEFGFTCTISVIYAILHLLICRKLSWRFLSIFIVGMTTTMLLLNLFYLVNERAINLNFLTIIAREFGAKGFGSWPMPVFGFFFVIFSITGLAIIFSIRRLNDEPPLNSVNNEETLIPDVGLAIFAGVWTLTSLVFYSARSVDGNLRVIFLPALIAALATMKITRPLPIGVFNQKVFRSAVLPLTTIMVLPIALLISAPDPHFNWSRLGRHSDSPAWSWQAIESKPVAKAYKELSESEIGKIGILGSDGNAISIVTGAKNILAVNVLNDLAMSAELKKEVCSKLEKSGVKLLLVEGVYERIDSYPCPGMTNPQIQANGQVTLFDYAPPRQD